MRRIFVEFASITALILSAPLAGCTTSLPGNYDGDLECDFGNISMEIDLEEDGDSYVGVGEIGDGTVADLTIYDYRATFTFEMEVDKDKQFGEQYLDVSLDDCELTLYGYGSTAIDCEDLDDVTWDGADEIEGEINDFLGLGSNCDFQLERVAPPKWRFEPGPILYGPGRRADP